MLRRLETLDGGTYRWELYVRFPDRQVHRHIKATKAGAQQIYADLVDAAARAKLKLPHKEPAKILAGPATLGAGAEAYGAEILAEGQNAQHVQAVARTLRDLRALKGDDFPIAKFNRNDVVNWRAWRLQQKKADKFRRGKLPSARTVNKEFAHLRRFFGWCIEQGYRDDNPAASVRRIKTPEPPDKVASWSDFSKAADYLWKKNPAAALFLEVLGETGARVNELIAAKAGDVDAERGIWTGVKKGRRTVSLPAFEWTLEAAKRAKDPSHPLCPSPKPKPDGQPQAWAYSTIRDTIERACKKVRIERFTPHAIRHGRSTWDVEAGLDPRTVQELRGHKTLATTERYFKTARVAQKVKATEGIFRRPPPQTSAALEKPRAGTKKGKGQGKGKRKR